MTNQVMLPRNNCPGQHRGFFLAAECKLSASDRAGRLIKRTIVHCGPAEANHPQARTDCQTIRMRRLQLLN